MEYVKALFFSVYEMKYRGFIKNYKKEKKNYFLSFENLKKLQEQQLRILIDYVYRHVPFYKELFKKLSIFPDDIKTIEDLEKLPVITKADIRKNYNKMFSPSSIRSLDYIKNTTGGSTGEPFEYRISKNAIMLERTLNTLHRTHIGYNIGDKVMYIGHTSIIPTKSINKTSLSWKFNNYFLNNRGYSSFNFSEKEIEKLVNYLNKWKPKYLYGYPSAMYSLVHYLENKHTNLSFSPKGILSTSETLHSFQRDKIEKILDTEVFNIYGINDGGISAHECNMHTGMHIDMRASITEIVDKYGNQLNQGKQGRIIATSLFNYAFPFIRYYTGDFGKLSYRECECGRNNPILTDAIGRESEVIISPNGNIIPSMMIPYLLYPRCAHTEFGMTQYKKIKNFRIIQESIKRIVIKIVKDTQIKEKEFEYIKTNFHEKLGKNTEVQLKFVDFIPPLKSGKQPYVISKISNI